MHKHFLLTSTAILASTLIMGCSCGSHNTMPETSAAIVDTTETTSAVTNMDITVSAEDTADPTESTGTRTENKTPPQTESIAFISDAISIEGNILEHTLRPAQSILLQPEASGLLTATNNYATVDYSHTEDGYVMVLFSASTQQKVKVQVVGPTTTYTYNLTPGLWTTFPLSDGNGTYTIKVFENIVDKRYAQVQAVNIAVTLIDEFAPFIRPNQYVNYIDAEAAIAKANELTKYTNDLLAKVSAIYDYVVTTIDYDYDKAATVQSGYLPDLDAVLASEKGICFDYASLMTGMLRSQGVPCKLVVGYAGSVYHAWISVWSESTGWIDGAVYFNGTSWQRMDPTFAASGRQDPAIAEFIGNGDNYTSKYIY